MRRWNVFMAFDFLFCHIGTVAFAWFVLIRAIQELLAINESDPGLWVLMIVGVVAAMVASRVLDKANRACHFLKVFELTFRAHQVHDIKEKCAIIPGKKKFLKEHRFGCWENFVLSSPTELQLPPRLQTFELEYITRNEDGVAMRLVKTIPYPILKEDIEEMAMARPEVGSIELVDVILVRGIPTSGTDQKSLDKSRTTISRNLDDLPKRIFNLRGSGATAYACAMIFFLVVYLVEDIGKTMLLVIGAVSLHILFLPVSGCIGMIIIQKCWADATDEEVERFCLRVKPPLATSTPIDANEDSEICAALARSDEAFQDEEGGGSSTGYTSQSTVSEGIV